MTHRENVLEETIAKLREQERKAKEREDNIRQEVNTTIGIISHMFNVYNSSYVQYSRIVPSDVCIFFIQCGVELSSLNLRLSDCQTRLLQEESKQQHMESRYNKQIQEQLQQLEKTHASDMENLNMRIRHMMEKKDLIIQQLKSNLDDKDARLRELDRLAR